MKTILVDDEILAMNFFMLECANIPEIEIVATFESPLTALEYAAGHHIDLAVLDIEMPQLNGIELGKKLKEFNPDITLIYITAHDEYAIAAYNLRAPVYLEKPYNKEDVVYALETAQLLARKNRKPIFFRTFGNFDVFLNDHLIHFPNKKSKEFLAYLVDRRGSSVNNDQAITVLWEDSVNDLRYQNKLRRVVKDLRDALISSGIDHILINSPNSRAIDPNAFDCDYYWFMDGNKKAAKLFSGEYMSEYSWAEETLGFLTRLAETENI